MSLSGEDIKMGTYKEHKRWFENRDLEFKLAA
jgi:hypothetical protein